MSNDPFDEPAGLGDRLDDLLLQLEAWLARSRPLVVSAGVVLAAGLLVAWAVRPTASSGPVDDLIPRAVSTTALAPAGASVGAGGPAPVPGDPAAAPIADAVEDPGPATELVVHVIGAVRRPGLVALGPGDRISDAIAGAGGAATGADVDRLNLAAPVVDGMQIRVPELGDEAARPGGAGDQPGAEAEPLVRLPTTAAPTAAVGQDPIDVNRASAAELERLPGIGPALAGRIVAWRSDRGAFVTVDDLEAVPGIGPATLDGLRDLVVV